MNTETLKDNIRRANEYYKKCIEKEKDEAKIKKLKDLIDKNNMELEMLRK